MQFYTLLLFFSVMMVFGQDQIARVTEEQIANLGNGKCFTKNRQATQISNNEPSPSSPPPPPVPTTKIRRVAGIEIPSEYLSDVNKALDYAVKKINLPVYGNLQDTCLSAHNIYRDLVGLRPLSYSSEAYGIAQRWADYLAGSGQFMHSNTKGVGENLFRVKNGRSEDWTCNRAIKDWFLEFPLYSDYERIADDPYRFKAYGHFTQLIWPETTQVGCAQKDGDWGLVTVCEYLPAGNVRGKQLKKTIGGQDVLK